jgi:magnesium transporter
MKLFSKQYHPPGTTPGTLAEPRTGKFKLSLFDYSPVSFSEQHELAAQQCRDFIEKDNVTWIHIQGEPTSEALRSLAAGFAIHDLYLEDVANIGQRPKLEIQDEQLFLILSLPLPGEHKVEIEQVSIFLNKNTVISFCSGDFNPFETIAQRLRATSGRMRKRQADYLFYSLIDNVIDYGFPLLEGYAEKIDLLEEGLLDNKSTTLVNEIHGLRRELLLLRRKLWPQREVINALLRKDDTKLIKEETQIFLRDCHDHIISVMELLETYHEMTSGLMDLYMSKVSMRLNDVMRVLTIIATLFIPPTFVVGLYGMNFNPQLGPLSMPELTWKYGYIAVVSVIVLMFVGMLLFFRKHKWL